MRLHELKSIKNNKKKKRVGRGFGSGKGGHTVGKGMKGQKSRSGFKQLRAWIRETKIKSFPKLRGIGKRNEKGSRKNMLRKKVVVNVEELKQFKNGQKIDRDLLIQKGLVNAKSKKVRIKILGKGEIDKTFTIEGVQTSKSAKEKIEKAGGKVI